MNGTANAVERMLPILALLQALPVADHMDRRDHKDSEHRNTDQAEDRRQGAYSGSS